jgi:hypothetical protein
VRSSSVTAVAFLVLWSLPVAAFAQQSDLDAQVQEGVRLRGANRPDEAIEHFRHLWERTHYPRALTQIALTEQSLGRWAEADRHFREVLAITDHVWVRQNRQVLQESLDAIAEHIGELDVQGAPPGAELWVNDQRAAVTPLAAPLRLAIGTAVIELRAPGFVTWQRTVTLAPRQLTRETAVMARAGGTPTATSQGNAVVPQSTSTPPTVITPPPTVVTRDPGATPRALGWVSLGLVAVGAGVGAIGALWRADLTAPGYVLQAQCQGASADACKSWGDQLGDAGILLGVGFGAAGAFLATGLTLLLTAPSREPAPRASLVCLPSPGGVGCALRF